MSENSVKDAGADLPNLSPQAAMDQYFHWSNMGADALLRDAGGPMPELPLFATPRFHEEWDRLVRENLEPGSVVSGPPDPAPLQETWAQALGVAYALNYVQQRVLYKRSDRNPDAVAAFKRAIPADSDTASLPYAQLTLPQVVASLTPSRPTRVPGFRSWADVRLAELKTTTSMLTRFQKPALSSLNQALNVSLRAAADFVRAHQAVLNQEGGASDLRLAARFLYGWNRVLQGYTLAHRVHEAATKGVKYPTLSHPAEAYGQICQRVLSDLADQDDRLYRLYLSHIWHRFAQGTPGLPVGGPLPMEDDLDRLMRTGFLNPFGTMLAEAAPSLGLSRSALDMFMSLARQTRPSSQPAPAPSSQPAPVPEAVLDRIVAEETRQATRVDVLVENDEAAPPAYGPWGSKAGLELARYLAQGQLFTDCAELRLWSHLSYKPAQEALARAGVSVSIHHHNLFQDLAERGLILIREVATGQTRRLYGAWTQQGVAALQQSGIRRWAPPLRPEHYAPVFQSHPATLDVFRALDKIAGGEGTHGAPDQAWHSLQNNTLGVKSASVRRQRLEQLVQAGLIELDKDGAFRILDPQVARSVRVKTAPEAPPPAAPEAPRSPARAALASLARMRIEDVPEVSPPEVGPSEEAEVKVAAVPEVNPPDEPEVKEAEKAPASNPGYDLSFEQLEDALVRLGRRSQEAGAPNLEAASELIVGAMRCLKEGGTAETKRLAEGHAMVGKQGAHFYATLPQVTALTGIPEAILLRRSAYKGPGYVLGLTLSVPGFGGRLVRGGFRLVLTSVPFPLNPPPAH